MRIIAKLLLLSLEEDEEVVLNAVMSALGSFENKTQLKEEIVCEKLAFAGMEIDASKRLVYRGEKEVNITFTEFEILRLLARNPGRVFSKEQIYDIVWKESYSGDYNIIMSHIRNIREKIEDNPSKTIYIQTVWGVGYRFNKNISSGLFFYKRNLDSNIECCTITLIEPTTSLIFHAQPGGTFGGVLR